MIVFVIVTAVLNIGLGYALAIYLGRGRDITAPQVSDIHEVVAEMSAAPSAHEPAPAPAAAPPIAAEAAPVPRPAASAPGVELEQDVLAGIEEFRNQLAQMKAQPAEAAELAAAR